MRFLLLVSVLLASPAWASHFFSCDVTAKVVETKAIARMDGQATFREGMDDYEQLATIEVLKTSNVGGHGYCLRPGEQHTLHVKQDQIGDYQKGQILELYHRNIGDFMGSRITWDVKE